MATYKVPVTRIKDIIPHPNADSLEIAKVYDFDVIVPKFSYKKDDLVIYIPVGSVLSPSLEALLFPTGSKIKLNKGRVRAIKIRSVVSHGMVVDPSVIPELTFELLVAEDDVADLLGVTKYQPSVSETPEVMRVNPNVNVLKNPEFKQYTDIEHGKYYDKNVMIPNEQVIVTMKLHGTSARYSWCPRPKRNLLDKVKAYFGLLPEWEWCWGSRRAQINAKPGKTHPGFKSEKQGCDFGDVYTKIMKQDSLKEKIPKGYAVYGEIVGDGIQKGYLYNCGMNQHMFYVYDVYNVLEKRWLNYDEAIKCCNEWGLRTVPLVYRGPFNNDKINELLPINVISKEVNEGVVVRPVQERTSSQMGRVVLKYINNEYLLRDNTEFQ